MLIIVIALLVLVIGVPLGGWLYLRRPLSDPVGTVHLVGPTGPTPMVRDSSGIPLSQPAALNPQSGSNGPMGGDHYCLIRAGHHHNLSYDLYWRPSYRHLTDLRNFDGSLRILSRTRHRG
jgi:hypothetical protein